MSGPSRCRDDDGLKALAIPWRNVGCVSTGPASEMRDHERIMTPSAARIQVCGRLAVELDGVRREQALPGPQGALLFAFPAADGFARRAGNPAQALKVYDDLRVVLRDELGVSPAAQTRDLHARLLR
jgi:Bacterial transcriptional activator domain